MERYEQMAKLVDETVRQALQEQAPISGASLMLVAIQTKALIDIAATMSKIAGNEGTIHIVTR